MEVSVLKCYTLAYVVNIFILHSSGQTLVPKGCYKSGSIAYCYPHIPSFLDINRWDLTGVSTFRLYSSSSLVWTLPTLPNDVFEMAKDITYLSMNNIGLENLPCDIFNPFRTSLDTIYLNGNLFREFPICALEGFAALKQIYLENQYLKAFQADMINWKAVRAIYLRNNELSIVNISEVHNQNEASLYLDNNKISILQIFDMNHIGYMSASHNQIDHVNLYIFKNSKTTLKYLDLSQNHLDNSIWDVLAGISSIQTMKLNNNKLSVVSSSVLNSAGNLVYLDISNNQLTSLANVALRSGKLNYLLLGSNKLTKIPTSVTSSTETFSTNPYNFDLSNNYIKQVHISIPTKATSLTVRLDRNRLRTITFENGNIEIYALNISFNDMEVLPQWLPKSRIYILSHNPLITENVLEKLENDMIEASTIELENVNMFCGQNIPNLPAITHKNLRSLNLNQNCVPLDIICHINTSCNTRMSLYLDNNIGSSITCSLQDKCFDQLSFNNCGLNRSVFDYNLRYDLQNYARKIFAKNNDFTHVPFFQDNSTVYIEFSYDFSMNKVKSFDGFDITAYRLSVLFDNNELVTVKPGVFRLLLSSAYMHLNYANNSLTNIDDSLAIFYINNFYFHIQLLIDMNSNSIEHIKMKNIIQVQYVGNSYYANLQLTLNISKNNIQSYDDCPNIDKKIILYITLDLSYNKITTLPNMPCAIVYKMFFGYNRIKQIVTPIPSAKTIILDLQWNSISNIHTNAFDNLTRLQELNLQGNLLQFFPSSINTLTTLSTLDISFNKIRHTRQSDLSNLKSLRKLIITDNDFFTPSYDFKLNPLYHQEENMIHCDCEMLYLRNLSFSPQFKVSGRCTSPSEYEGYHVSCFPRNQCVGIVPLYITKTTVETCQNDIFSDISMELEEFGSTIISHVSVLGKRIPVNINMNAYMNEQFLKAVHLNKTGRSYSFLLDRSLEASRLCFSAVFDNNDTIARCFAAKFENNYNQDKLEGNSGTLYGIGSLLAISLLVNILTGLFIFITYRNKHTKSKKPYLNGEDNKERYEITSISDNVNNESLSQPVYEEISNPENNKGDNVYANLALEI